jgi:hypothetical protein
MAHPRVISWQKTWLGDEGYGAADDNPWLEMDCDEAITRYHSQVEM